MTRQANCPPSAGAPRFSTSTSELSSSYDDQVLLRPDDPLPATPSRILVAGTSGSGKTTLARRLGEALDLPHTELDALFHGPGWKPREAFTADVDTFTSKDRWVTEWQYSTVLRDLVTDRADLVVWLDLPRALVTRQVVLRTLHRRVRRQVLWNGNLEPPLWTVFRDQDHVVRWAWRTHKKSAERVATLHHRRPDLPIVRFTGHHETSCWIQRLASVGT